MRLAITIALLLMSFSLAGDAEESGHESAPNKIPLGPSFWVWNRNQGLSDRSIEELTRVNTSRLYWQIADLENPYKPFITHRRSSHLLDDKRITLTAVIRLPPGRDSILSPIQRELIRDSIRSSLVDFPATPIQLDYDCPANILNDYAAFLKALRSELAIQHLSVTALASWVDSPGFKTLAASVDEVVPMFYDLEADHAHEIKNGSPRALIDDTTILWIERWRAWPIPWQPRLPNFQRLTLFKDDGTLIGHHPHWSVSGLLSHPAIKQLPESPTHTRQFEVLAKGRLSNVAIKPGQTLIWRAPDEDLTVKAIETARKAGASSILWFAHPDSAPTAWHSATHLANLQSGRETQPNLQLSVSKDGQIILTNSGSGDLPPRPNGELWSLVLESETLGSFNQFNPGNFISIDAPGASLANPQFSRKVVLAFAALRANNSIKSATQLITDPATSPDWHLFPTP